MNIDRTPCLIRVPEHLASEGYRTCDPCSSRMRDELDDIVRLYPLVDQEVHYGTSSDGGPRGSTVYHSAPLINFARVDRAQRFDQANVAEILSSWADNVREDIGLAAVQGLQSVTGASVLLVRMWSWIRAQDWVADLAAELFDLRRTLQQLAGETRGRIPIGLCPQVVDHHPRTGALITCGQHLHVRPGDRIVHCPQCSTAYPAYRWDELHAAQGAA